MILAGNPRIWLKNHQKLADFALKCGYRVICTSRSKTAKFQSATTVFWGNARKFWGNGPISGALTPIFGAMLQKFGAMALIWGALTPDLGTFVVRGTKLGRFLSGLGIESIFQSKMKGKGMEKTQSLGIGPPSKGTTF